MSKRNIDKTGRSEKAPRHIRLYHWVYDSDAWQDLNPLDCCIYFELLRRYSGPGTNNGHIPLSVREVTDLFKVGKSTAARSFKRLQEHGFISVSVRGRFERRDRHATEWRLTEFQCDATGELATKEFMRWKKSDGPTVGTVGTCGGTLGTCSGTVEGQNPSDGTRGGTVKPRKAA